jgi:hypothetical protein
MNERNVMVKKACEEPCERIESGKGCIAKLTQELMS